MSRDFSIRTSDQLPSMLQAFRKQSGMKQAEVALRMGMSQQTYSALERTADRVSTKRLLKLFGVLGVEMVLRKSSSQQNMIDPRDADTDREPNW